MSFLPDNFEGVPMEAGIFLNKFEQGETRIRVLGSVTFGYRYWNLDNKPRYIREVPEVMPPDVKLDDKGNARVQYFWAFPVWNVTAKKLQVATITQKSVLKEIEGLYRDADWGDPVSYDMKITRTGTGFNDTEYTVNPAPKSPIPREAKAALQEVSIDLNELFKPDGKVIGEGSTELPSPPPTPQELGEPTEEEMASQKTSSEEEINIEDIPF